MDSQSLLRLADKGLAAYPPAELSTLADWCWDIGESTGDARYSSLWRSLDLISDLFAEHGALPTGMVARLDEALHYWMPKIIGAADASEGSQFARLMREDLARAIL